MINLSTSIIQPKGVELDQNSYSETFGKFVCVPLERGYGTTLGNALRRVLLSSIPGTAVVAFKMAGTLHEFKSIPKIKEDVIDIKLNLKGLIVKMDEDKDEAVCKLKVKGPGKILAKDIETPSGVEILNKDHYLLTLEEGGEVDMELFCARGFGYVTEEELDDGKDEIGKIYIDAIFSPVRKVNFTVSPVMVGDRTDYDKLTIEVTTNGVVTPEQAISKAAKILIEQFSYFVSLDGKDRSDKVHEVVKGGKEDIDSNQKDLLDKKIESLEISTRTKNCLKTIGIDYLGQLVARSKKDLLMEKSFGRKSLKEIEEALESLGLSLDMNVGGWQPPSEE